MKEKIFYFSWAFVRAVNKNYYTKVKFGNYTEDLFYFGQIMFLTYERNPFNEKEPFTFEILRPYNENEIERRGMFERIIFMQEYDKIFAWVKTLPNFGFDFYVELLRKIKVSNDNDVVDWLITKGVNLADMWEPTEHQKELMIDIKELMIDIDVTWVWTTEVIEFLEDEKTFGEHHWEYGKVIEFLNRPRYKEKVYDALDKALQIEQLENRQDLVDHLRTFSDIAETHFNKAKYKKWVIYPNNVKWMESWTKSQPQQATCIEQEQLFKDKYREYFSDIDNFVNMLNKMKGAELREYFNSCLNKSHINLKVFCDDVFKLTPQRLGEKGWNYEAIRKH